MKIDIEVEDDELIIHVPRKMILDKAREKDKATEPANIHDIINNVMKGLENAIENRQEQESNQRQHTNRGQRRQATETSHCNSDEQGREEQELGPMTERYLSCISDDGTRIILRHLLQTSFELHERIQAIEETIEESEEAYD